jgi:site-specific DNA-cytosine methylase
MGINYVSDKVGFNDRKAIHQFILSPEAPRLLEGLADYLEALYGKRKIVVVDLFCGGGGFTTGAIQAGAVVALSIDCWEPAEKVHHENHPTVPFVNMALGDIEADVELIREYVQPYIDLGYHFHFHGSPPCQDISVASRGNPEDGMVLVMHYLELVDRLAPDSWSMENVPPVRKLLPDHVPTVILNSAEFGVPQQRRRCFAGEGWEVRRTNTNHNLKGVKNKHLPGFKTVLDALPHLRDEYIDLLRGYSRTRPVLEKGIHTGVNTPRIPPDGCIDISKEPSYAICGASVELWGKVIILAEDAISGLDLPEGVYSIDAVMDSGRSNAPTCGINPATGEKQGGSGFLSKSLDEPSYTITSSSTSIGMTINNASVSDSNSSRARSSDVEINEPSNTVTGRGFTVRSNIDDGVNYRKVRNLTIAEMATLQHFPEDYSFGTAKTKKDKHIIVGNAVCPGVAKAVIEGIILED